MKALRRQATFWGSILCALLLVVITVVWVTEHIEARNARHSLRRKLAPFIAPNSATPQQLTLSVSYFNDDLERARPFLTNETLRQAVELRVLASALGFFISSPVCLRVTPEILDLLNNTGLADSEIVFTSPEIEEWRLNADEIDRIMTLVRNHSPDEHLSDHELSKASYLKVWASQHPTEPKNASTNFVSSRICASILRLHCKDAATQLAKHLE